jgi:hypothetical protein
MLAVDAAFRPPAIPLVTTDPYLQSFVMGDTATDGVVKHWDQRDKEMLGMIRIDGTVYRYLGDCGKALAPAGPAEYHEGKDVAPGKCDVSNTVADNTTCNSMCYNEPSCKAYVVRGDHCWLKSCTDPLVDSSDSTGAIITAPHPDMPSTCDYPALEQLSVSVQATQTVFQLRDPKARVELNVTFLSTLFTDDYPRLSRPVSYIVHDIKSLDDTVGTVEFYTDASAQWVVNTESEEVQWGSMPDGKSLQGTYLGTQDQNVLGTKGDKTNINWGYLYLASASGSSRAGSAADQRKAFGSTGTLPTVPDSRMPRAASDDMPSLAVVQKLEQVTTSVQRHTVMIAYDDVLSVQYYNEGQFPGFWTKTWSDIFDAMSDAYAELDEMLARSLSHDDELMAKLTAVGGEKYAAIGALTYRQTLAATKLVWNTKRGEMWNFLKEISTNGDMQTMDVVYPASPMMMYTNPDLLKQLLIPVLAFANNETSTPFFNPFSPHEIGTYPIADHNTAQQEPMPMENTGNMFLMLAGIVKFDPSHDASFYYPQYWPLLTSWADYLQSTLPFPEEQLCTDDFTGRLGNNTNLAAKGIVALEAFAGLCESAGATDCEKYRTAARGFAKTWKDEAWEEDHFKIAYDFPNSYSIKYNMVWQKLLDMEGPFDWEGIFPVEVQYYISKANAFGVPMDSRHTYVKLDWLSWGATMADDDESFHTIFDPIYDQANATDCRVPLTDLFDTITATCSYGKQSFVDRPVNGGVYAKMLRNEAEARRAMLV